MLLFVVRKLCISYDKCRNIDRFHFLIASIHTALRTGNHHAQNPHSNEAYSPDSLKGAHIVLAILVLTAFKIVLSSIGKSSCWSLLSFLALYKALLSSILNLVTFSSLAFLMVCVRAGFPIHSNGEFN